MKSGRTTDTSEPASRGRVRVFPERPELDGFELEFTARGHGEPLLLVHGGLLSGWFGALLREPALSEGYRLISYHRPGYGTSSQPSAAFSIEDQSRCCQALLRHVGVEKAHVVGHSIGGCIGLQLALDAPDVVRSLALLEPPVLSAVVNPSNGAQVAREAAQRWHQGDTSGAIDLFMKGMVDPEYQKFFDDRWPDGVEDAFDGANAFFGTDQPSVQRWTFTAEEAARVTQPVLLVIGDRSARLNPIRSQIQSSLLGWLPHAEPFTLSDSTHLLPLQNPSGLAKALVDFYGRS